VLLGLEPDLPSGRVYIDPALPPWCPTFELSKLKLGGHELRLNASRRDDGTSALDAEATPGLEIVQGPAPWMNLSSD
jgi:hypothetical protein